MKISELSPKDAEKLKDAVFMDIRSFAEHSVVSISGSIHLDETQLTPELRSRFDKNKPIVVYCGNGCRSAAVAEKLFELGFKNVHTLAGGLKRWRSEGLKIVTSPFERYLRQITIPQVGIAGQKKLLSSKALIVGLGGLGSPIAFYLAGAGVGTIGLLDDDKVSLDNLGRQIIHSTSSIGIRKTRSAHKTIEQFNPDIKLITHDVRIESANAADVIKDYDLVIDGTDNFKTRYALNEACVKLKKPFIYGAILRFTGHVSVFDISKGSGCYACLFPTQPQGEFAQTCVETGVIGVMTGIIGTLEALEAIKLIAGFGKPLIGKLLVYDALNFEMKVFDKVNRDPECRVCKETPCPKTS